MDNTKETRTWRKQLERFDYLRGHEILNHWKGFVETWQLSEKSICTVANVWDSAKLVLVRPEFSTWTCWNDAGQVFKDFHKLSKERNWSPTTFNTHRKNINTYFIFLKRRGIITENPLGRIEKRREHQSNYDVPTKQECQIMLAYLMGRKWLSRMQNKRDILFYSLLNLTGARPGELLQLKFSQVEDRKSVQINGSKIWGKPRSYPLSEEVRIALSDYLREVADSGRSSELESYLFLGSKGWKWSYSGIRKLFKRINRESGISKTLTCYSFRRRNATQLYIWGLALENISKYMGHSRTATTMRYIQNLPEVNREAVEMLRL